MNIKSEKGFTGVDIAISVVVLFIFVSLIAMLSYNINSSSKEIEYKSEAIYIAIDEIEKFKNIAFEEIEDVNKDTESKNITINGETTQKTFGKKDVNGNIIQGQQAIVENGNETGFYKTIFVEDYQDINSEKIPNLVKKITVQISYMFKGKEQKVELYTILSKES